MQAIILAGGKEKTQLGRLHGTALLPISIVGEGNVLPAINRNVDKLLNVGVIDEIIVLTKKEQKSRFTYCVLKRSRN